MLEEKNNNEEENNNEKQDIKQSWNIFKKFWSIIEHDMNWFMICIIIVLVMNQNMTMCNNYYQEKLLNNTFLQDMMEYNNEHKMLYSFPDYDTDYTTMIPKKPQTLNIIKHNNTIVEEK